MLTGHQQAVQQRLGTAAQRTIVANCINDDSDGN
jgi:hypothetical protein